jgi:predicted Zn-dependent protease
MSKEPVTCTRYGFFFAENLMKLALFCLLLFPLAGHAAPLDIPPAATPQEIEQGRKSAEEFERAKTTRLLDPKSSPEAKNLLDKLNGMAKRLGAVSSRPRITYSVSVVESKDVNAFTLPNGKIYIFRGLLDTVASDDEIAGVIAHEIGHNTRMHALRGQKQAKKLSWANLAAFAMILAGGENGANIAQFSQYALIGVLNGHGVGYEKEADEDGIQTMIAAGYNPSALVTFMRRLQQKEERTSEMKLGIFQTHPPSEERAEAMLGQLQKKGVKFTPRDVAGAKIVEVKQNSDRLALQIGDLTLLKLAKNGPDAPKRAQNIAAKINEMLRADLQMHEISVTPDGRLLARGQFIAAANTFDQKLSSTNNALGWRDNFKKLFWKERLNGRF